MHIEHDFTFVCRSGHSLHFRSTTKVLCLSGATKLGRHSAAAQTRARVDCGIEVCRACLRSGGWGINANVVTRLHDPEVFAKPLGLCQKVGSRHVFLLDGHGFVQGVGRAQTGLCTANDLSIKNAGCRVSGGPTSLGGTQRHHRLVHVLIAKLTCSEHM